MDSLKKYDCLIVGAGPAGLFSAYELITNNPKLRILVCEKGNLIQNRGKTEMMSGVGGAGTYSDGKLHFTPVLSHEKMFHLYSVEEYNPILQRVDDIFLQFGVTTPISPQDMSQADKLVKECADNGIKLLVRKVRHVGSDLLPKVILNFQEFLIKNGVEFLAKTEVSDILLEDHHCVGVMTIDNKKIFGENILLSPGRIGAKWLQDLCRKYDIEYTFDKVEVGVRVETLATVMDKFSNVAYESIYLITAPTTGDVVRNFCPCPRGFVAQEEYGDFVAVNGHSNSDHKSLNSNFAFTAEINLSEPYENTINYALAIAKLVNIAGGGKPLIQSLTGFKKGQRSTWERLKNNGIIPSLTDVVPGDISMALPGRITQDLKEAFDILEKVMPGINSDNTLIYAPEVKLRSSKVKTNKYLETKIENLFVAGDGAGLSGSITGAAVNGLIVAKGMMGKSENPNRLFR
ncbi:MAG: FAD-dependent oxidoreductase [Candidatus Pacebacteria bacterium]|nr:FAD-dependent oxidoreductase [Candidatus Paceibacterota bacterium]